VPETGWEAVARSHEGKIGRLEEGVQDLKSRMETVEEVVRSLQGLGWKIAVGFVLSFFAPFVANWLARGGHL
jgi:hypothetical protein